ncbi:MAG: hypothetical protein Q9168_004292 [Polycauliona sp. 1 TL-2023]
MAKRRRDSADGSPHEKRRRLTTSDSIKPSKTSIEDITSVKQLQDLLSFSQDAGPNTKQIVVRDINTFKLYLESIAYGDDAALQLSRRTILLHHLNPEPTPNADRQHPAVSELFQAWSFAAQSNNESLYSAITAVLALLLKTISYHLDFRIAGRDLCDRLLEKDHLKLLERGLSAEKSKDHIISPGLRLLTQIVAFDGGYAAKRVYRNKDVTFKRLDTFLTLRPDTKAADSRSRRKIPVRNLALKYLFAHLRLQDHAIKAEILAHGRLSRSLFQDIKEDPPSVIRETLQVMRDDVLEDERIPFRAKGRLFTDQVLYAIATLENYDNDTNSDDDDDDKEKPKLPEVAHTFLLSLCTQPQYGVLVGSGVQTANKTQGSSEKHQERVSSSKRMHKRAAVQNTTLSSFLQMLRPYASIPQRDLTLAVFQAAPELISDYFHHKKSFSFEPKLTATWLGFAAFLLSTIQLPLHQSPLTSEEPVLAPPATFDIIESILPLPLSSKAVSRCLNQSITIIRFFAIKIMIAAFTKYAQTAAYFRSKAQIARGHSKQLWDQAASELKDEFSQRCPDMSHVITVFRSCNSQDSLLRESSARLLSLYYRQLPQIALEQKFDASVVLSAVSDEMSLGGSPLMELNIQSMLLTQLLDIGRCSPDMRWWQKSENDELSLFGKGLRLCTRLFRNSRIRSLDTLLQSALSEAVSLDAAYENPLLPFLLRSLVSDEGSTRSHGAEYVSSSSPSRQNYFLRAPVSGERSPSQGRSWSGDPQEVYTCADDCAWQPSDALFQFLDNCLIRLAKKTVKYDQDLLTLRVGIKQTPTHDADMVAGKLLVVVTEQWPFVQTSATIPDMENISHWLSRFLLVVVRNGGDAKFFDRIRGQVTRLTTLQQCQMWVKKGSVRHIAEGIDFEVLERPGHTTLKETNLADRKILKAEVRKEEWQPPTPPASEGEDHPGLGKWKKLGIEEAIVEGAIEELMLCLCSRYGEIRRQALTELQRWMKALQTSDYGEREATYLLVGEVIETCKTWIGDTGLPRFAGVMAAECCLVLSDPLHILYAKVNRFLNKGPVWKVERLPSYWVEQIVMRLPSIDDGYYKEIEWLLIILTKGLQTSADMELYRRSHILERLFSLLTSPSLPAVQQKRVMELLYRYIQVGGSTTLITRCSLLSWVPSYLTSGQLIQGEDIMLEKLVARCKSDCEQERIHSWSDGKLLETAQQAPQAL